MKMCRLKNRAWLRRLRLTAHDTNLSRAQHQGQVTSEGGALSVNEIEMRLVWGQLVFAECLDLLLRDLPQHLLLAAENQRRRTRDAGTKRHSLRLPMLVVGKLRPGPNQTHVAEEHIHQLWQLVQFVAAKKASYCGDATITMPGYRKPLGLRLGLHGAELVD